MHYIFLSSLDTIKYHVKTKIKAQLKQALDNTVEAIKFIAPFVSPHTLVAKLGIALAALQAAAKKKPKK